MILLLVNIQPSSVERNQRPIFQIKLYPSDIFFLEICSKTSNWPSILFDGSHTILILKGEGGWIPVFIVSFLFAKISAKLKNESAYETYRVFANFIQHYFGLFLQQI